MQIKGCTEQRPDFVWTSDIPAQRFHLLLVDLQLESLHIEALYRIGTVKKEWREIRKMNGAETGTRGERKDKEGTIPWAKPLQTLTDG